MISMNRTIPLIALMAVCLVSLAVPAADAAGLSGYASNDDVTVTYLEDSTGGPKMFINLAKMPSGAMQISVYTTQHYPVVGLNVPAEKNFGIYTGVLLAQTYTVLIAQGEHEIANIEIVIGDFSIRSITYAAGGGTGEMIPSYTESGKEAVLQDCGFTAPSGKEFKSWSVNGTEYQPGAKLMLVSDLTAVAVWQDAPEDDMNLIYVILVVAVIVIAALLVFFLIRKR